MPSIPEIPTLAVQKLDSDDGAGWTYCYQYESWNGCVDDTFYSLFDGLDDIFVQVSNESNCERKYPAIIAPASTVNQVAFLFEQTTSYANYPTSIRITTRSSSSELSYTSVLADPFYIAPSFTNAPESLQPFSTKALATSSVPDKTEHSEELVVPSTVSEPNRPIVSTSFDAGPTSPVSIAGSAHPGGNGEPSETVVSRSLPFDTLNSMINVIAAARSSLTTSPEASTSNLVIPSQLEASQARTTATSTNNADLSAISSYTIGLTATVKPIDGVVYTADTNGDKFTNKEASPADTAAMQTAYDETYVSVSEGATLTAGVAIGNVFGGQTLRPGSSAVVSSGTSISLAQGATAVVFGTETAILAHPTSTNIVTVLTIGGLTVTAITISPKTSDLDISNEAQVSTTDDAAATANAASEYVLASQTLRPGASAITLSGVRASLAPDGTALVIDTETRHLESTKGIGNYVMSGIAGVSVAAQDSSTAASDSTYASATSNGSTISETATSVPSPLPSADQGSSSSAPGAHDSSFLSSSSNTVFASDSVPRSRMTKTAFVILLTIGVFLFF
jgi:hypothetical protein